MDTATAYNKWSDQYDASHNLTRDLEAIALRDKLSALPFTSCLEIGCGTGKNTEWLLQKAESITAVDFSEGMLEKARARITSEKVKFVVADINNEWEFIHDFFDLICFSLVLEHIEHLDHVFKEVFKALKPGGYVYIGELHPFKQYQGSKARFETNEGTHILSCFTHHVSDFTENAKKYGFAIAGLDEYFDNEDRSSVPRILTIVLQKPSI